MAPGPGLGRPAAEQAPLRPRLAMPRSLMMIEALANHRTSSPHHDRRKCLASVSRKGPPTRIMAAASSSWHRGRIAAAAMVRGRQVESTTTSESDMRLTHGTVHCASMETCNGTTEGARAGQA
eukprot:2585415-Rhodomonas_salina.5